MLRYLNMFLIIGVALVLVSLAGFATNDRFLMEPGQAPNSNLSLIYLGAAALMIINGLVSIKLTRFVAPAGGNATQNLSDQSDSAEQVVTESDVP